MTHHALEPNVFYESWSLSSALRFLAHNERIVIILIQGNDQYSPQRILYGLFPLILQKKYFGFPIKTLSLWRHLYCFLCTPLIHRDYADICLHAFLSWLRSNPYGARLMNFNRIPGEGLFYNLLVKHLGTNALPNLITNTSTRAILIPRESGGTYIENAISRKRRKEYLRLQNRLSDLGSLEFITFNQDGHIHTWIDEFLKLEASGWKGRVKTAIACHQADLAYFKEMTLNAYEQQKLVMHAVHLNGKAIAMKYNYVTGTGSYAFKIAYDEHFEKYSPGVLLELYNIEYFHQTPNIHWMDSCAKEHHPMIEHLWLEKRIILTHLSSLGTKTGNLFLSILPVIKHLKHLLNKHEKS